MRFAFIVALAAVTVQAAKPEGNAQVKLDVAAFTRAADSVDNGFRSLWPEYPAEVIGVTQGIYIRGYGAVLSGQVNLAPLGGITPFHPAFTRDDIARAHAKKLERLPKVLDQMQALLVSAAQTLADVPDNEEIAIGISFFYWHDEDRKDLPRQVVMHASKKALAAASRDKSQLTEALHVERY